MAYRITACLLSSLLLLTVLLFCLLDAAKGGDVNMSVPVYTQEQTTSKYLHYGPGVLLPAMSESTFCMWYNAVPDGDDWNRDYLISISTTAEANEMILGIDRDFKMRLEIRGTANVMSAETAQMYDARLIGWHRHCWTWKAAGQFKWYTTRLEDDNVMELWKEVNVGTATIRGDGILILMNEQDSYGGGFDVTQLMLGGVALFNVWDYELTLQEIQSVGCQAQGNLLTMSDLSIQGTAGYTEEVLSCGTKEEAVELVTDRMRKVYNAREKSINFCQVEGARLSNHTIRTITAATVRDCLLACATDSQCLSVNFIVSSSSCELNNAASSDWNIRADDYIDQLDSADFIYFTSHKLC